jgi:hypothetical protein
MREVNLEGCKRPIGIPIDYSNEEGGDDVDIHETLTIACEPLLGPPQEVSPPAKSVEKIAPGTPVTLPGPPAVPEIKPPLVEEIGEPIFGGGGGGGLPKLKTGIRAKCPTTASTCGVSGAILPSGASGAHKSSAKQQIVSIGSVSFKLAAGGSSPVSIPLTRAGLALLRKHRRLPVTISVSVSAPGVATVKHTRRATVRLPAKH